MKLKRLSCLFLLTLFLNTAFARDDEQTRQSLKGIQGVYVLVEDLDPPEVAAGLTKEQIQTDVEVKLRIAGIKVLTESEMYSTPGMPTLYVDVSIAARGEPWGFSIVIELQQNVFLSRNSSRAVSIGTWSVGSIGTAGSSIAPGYIRDWVKDLTDKFINAYLSVNPK